jgi:predicted ATPase/transcriptional regulator with XRE-family HTH domain
MSTDPEVTEFATLLRRFRLGEGLTQNALAERASLGVRTIQDLERGTHSPLSQSLKQLVRALALTGERRSEFEAAARPTPRQPRVIALPRRFHPVATETPSSPAPRHNLPAPLTSFVGRVAEIAEIEARLREGSNPPRLLTLIGFGGSGKTRLALRVAEDVRGDYPDGVWLVDLSALADHTLVADAVAATLSVPTQSGRPVLTSVVDYLYSKKVLLVFDNCEHLVVACAELASTVLSRCPAVTILATSRERLGIDGEASWPVPPLAAPPHGDLPAVNELVRYDAVRLFVERARTVRPAFALTTRNGSAVVQICHRLDGIPLAIELAAALVRVLTVEQIDRRLDDRFALLTGGSRNGDPRHHTLRATVDWSFGLLNEAERILLRRLAVFNGGWTLDAAAGICVGEEIAEAEVLELLTSLVDKSLVVADGETDGVERYRLLETLRQFGWERLAASGEATEVQKRHAAYFLALVDGCVRKQTSEGPVSRSWDDGLEAEQANLRATLVWYGDNDSANGLRMAAGLSWYWVFHDNLAEGEGWLSAFLAQTPGETIVRGRALLGLATLKRNRGDLDTAQRLYEQSLALCRQVDDRWGIARSLGMLAQQARSAADYSQAIALTEESLLKLHHKGE